MKPGFDVSVVVCTKDRAGHLRRALAGLALQTFGDYEVVLIDQSRTDETRDLAWEFRDRVPNLHYVHVSEPGLSRAYNRGIREASAELLAFTDDDCLVPEEWVQSIWDAFRKAAHVDVIYGQVLVPPEFEGTPTAALIPTLPITERDELNRSRGFRVFGMAANFAARRGRLEAVGGFDEVLGGGGPLQSTQDFDFAYRVYRSGGAILLEPDIISYHYGIRPTEDWPALMRSYGVGSGGFYGKHMRLRDVRAAGLFAHHACLAVIGAARATALRRSDARDKQQFLAGMWAGIRASFAFPIDGATRMFRAGHLEAAMRK